jgi:hypothetical protein
MRPLEDALFSSAIESEIRKADTIFASENASTKDNGIGARSDTGGRYGRTVLMESD